MISIEITRLPLRLPCPNYLVIALFPALIFLAAVVA